MLIKWCRADQDPLNVGFFPCREDLELRPRDLELFFPYKEDTSVEYGLWACSASFFHMTRAKRFSFRQMRFVLGWGPKPKLDDGLDI